MVSWLNVSRKKPPLAHDDLRWKKDVVSTFMIKMNLQKFDIMFIILSILIQEVYIVLLLKLYTYLSCTSDINAQFNLMVDQKPTESTQGGQRGKRIESIGTRIFGMVNP